MENTNTNTNTNTNNTINESEKMNFGKSIIKNDRFAAKAKEKQGAKLERQRKNGKVWTGHTNTTAARVDALENGVSITAIYISVLAIINRADKGKAPQFSLQMKAAKVTAQTMKAALKLATEKGTLKAYINSHGVVDPAQVAGRLLNDCAKAQHKEDTKTKDTKTKDTKGQGKGKEGKNVDSTKETKGKGKGTK